MPVTGGFEISPFTPSIKLLVFITVLKPLNFLCYHAINVMNPKQALRFAVAVSYHRSKSSAVNRCFLCLFFITY